MYENKKFDSEGFNNLITRRFFITPSFEIYGGVAGLYDYGPSGCIMKDNILQLWKKHFVLQENMLMIEATSLTPESVLKASGHCDRFTDFLVKDLTTELCYRADHLLEDTLDKKIASGDLSNDQIKDAQNDRIQADAFNQSELTTCLNKWNVLSPANNKLSEPYEFNLMFGTQIGPTKNTQGYLRPETAQGIFVNFKRLLEYNGNKIPFACAQIGHAFRNEIAPRNGILRVREFQQCEIEHFVHPLKKQHPKFDSVKNMIVNLYPEENQMGNQKIIQMTLDNAVNNKVINNQTLAYFIGRTNLFLLKCGIKPNKLRFRQHLKHEMAHYASDCWDAEIEMSYGWIECVGIADRSAYDLQVHSQKSNTELTAYQVYDQPQEIIQHEIILNKRVLGKRFGDNSAMIFDYINKLSQEQLANIKSQIDSDGKTNLLINDNIIEFSKDDISIKLNNKKVSGEKYTPHVIEPSFGVGRIMYGVLEHSYWVRGDTNNDQIEQRKVLALSPLIAPIKCIILPLSNNNDELNQLVHHISDLLTDKEITNKIDETSASIGKRYSRNDEIGVPFGITVDFDTINDQRITLRERDTTEQVRGSIDDIIETVHKLCTNKMTWDDVLRIFSLYKN